MPRILLATLLACTCLLGVAEDTDTPELSETAYAVVSKENDWKAFIKDVDGKYETWQSDNPNMDRNTYFNTKLLEVAPSAKGGDVKNVKKFVYWLALYKHYNELPPSYIREAPAEYKKEAAKLSKDFSWEKLAKIATEKVKEVEKTGKPIEIAKDSK